MSVEDAYIIGFFVGVAMTMIAVVAVFLFDELTR